MFKPQNHHRPCGTTEKKSSFLKAFFFISILWNPGPCYGEFNANYYARQVDVGLSGSFESYKKVRSTIGCACICATSSCVGFSITGSSDTDLTCAIYSSITDQLLLVGSSTYLTHRSNLQTTVTSTSVTQTSSVTQTPTTQAYDVLHDGKPMLLYPITSPNLDWSAANQWCTDNGATMFIPKAATDWTFMANTKLELGYDHLWIPISDLATEGTFLWTDGTDASTATYLTWYLHQFSLNTETDDCVSAHSFSPTLQAHLDDCTTTYDGIICEVL